MAKIEARERYPRESYLSPTVLPVEDGLEGALNHWAEQCEMAKWGLSLRLFTNIAFLLGNQYPIFNYVLPLGALTKYLEACRAEK